MRGGLEREYASVALVRPAKVGVGELGRACARAADGAREEGESGRPCPGRPGVSLHPAAAAGAAEDPAQ
jgi:hypothetical protein